MLLANILLALAWAAMEGDFSLPALVIGYLVGYLILAGLGRGGLLSTRFASRVKGFFALAAFFIWELVLANVRVALDVLWPGYDMRPGIIAVPLDVTQDGEILLLSALINITPGSVTLDLSDDRRTLYVHVMHVHDPDEARQEIKEGYERRVARLFR